MLSPEEAAIINLFRAMKSEHSLFEPAPYFPLLSYDGLSTMNSLANGIPLSEWNKRYDKKYKELSNNTTITDDKLNSLFKETMQQIHKKLTPKQEVK